MSGADWHLEKTHRHLKQPQGSGELSWKEGGRCVRHTRACAACRATVYALSTCCAAELAKLVLVRMLMGTCECRTCSLCIVVGAWLKCGCLPTLEGEYALYLRSLCTFLPVLVSQPCPACLRPHVIHTLRKCIGYCLSAFLTGVLRISDLFKQTKYCQMYLRIVGWSVLIGRFLLVYLLGSVELCHMCVCAVHAAALGPTVSYVHTCVCVQVILAIDQTRLPGMKRVLEAGGAQVVGIRPPYAKFSEATHAFVDFWKLDKLNIDKVRINMSLLH